MVEFATAAFLLASNERSCTPVRVCVRGRGDLPRVLLRDPEVVVRHAQHRDLRAPRAARRPGSHARAAETEPQRD